MCCKSFYRGSCGKRGEIMLRGAEMDLARQHTRELDPCPRQCLCYRQRRVSCAAGEVQDVHETCSAARLATQQRRGILDVFRRGNSTGPAGSEHGCSSTADDTARRAKSAISCVRLQKAAGRAQPSDPRRRSL